LGAAHGPAGAGSAVLASPLPPGACLARLAAAADRPWSSSGGGSVVGRVSGDRFIGRRRISYRNSFQPRVVAHLQAQGGGTLVHCRFGTHPAVVVFTVAWVGIVSTVAVGPLAYLAGTVFRGQPLDADWAVDLIPAGMAVFGIALFLAGRLIGRGDRAVLLAFLRETLDARDAPDL
jgi:hypothetical protein